MNEDLSAQEPIKYPQNFPLNQQIYPKPNYNPQAPMTVNIMEAHNQGINNINIDYPSNPENQMMKYPPYQQNLPIMDNNAIMAQIIKGQEDQRNREKDKEIQDLKDKLNEEKFKQLQNYNEQILANQRMQAVMINQGNNQPNININNNNNNINTNVAGVGGVVTRLAIPGGMWCILLILNIFLPGIGTIFAGAIYGKTVVPDRTGVVICHGIFQIITCYIIIGWIWAIIDVLHYFG